MVLFIAANCLLNESHTGKWHLKITDFGEMCVSREDDTASSSHSTLHTCVKERGSKVFLPPEKSIKLWKDEFKIAKKNAELKEEREESRWFVFVGSDDVSR